MQALRYTRPENFPERDWLTPGPAHRGEDSLFTPVDKTVEMQVARRAILWTPSVWHHVCTPSVNPSFKVDERRPEPNVSKFGRGLEDSFRRAHHR